jgi:hypothetical protein
VNAPRAVAGLTLLAAALAGRRAPAAEGGPSTKIFPLPMYATTPNEGNTYGFLPVFLRVGSSAAITSITAPSISWNAAAGVNTTFRFYRYLDPARTYSVIAAASTHVNRTLLVQYEDAGREPGRTSGNGMLWVRRNLFYRYFGLGPETTKADESSYTRLLATLNGRWGYNVTSHLNVGGLAEVRADGTQAHAIFNLPLLHDRYPDAPGIDGAALARQGVSVRYDTRQGPGTEAPGGVYAPSGFYTDLSASIAEGLTGFHHLFGQLTWDTRALIPETSFLQLAGHAYWTQVVGGGDIPFYYRPSLGGELLLRGFPEDRFIDNGAWAIGVEQRVRLLETHIFGVTTAWRIDPFVTAGQVYQGAALLSHVRVAGGLGFRIWVKPNVLGRIDVAFSDEGLRAYVVLGYPF